MQNIIHTNNNKERHKKTWDFWIQKIVPYFLLGVLIAFLFEKVLFPTEELDDYYAVYKVTEEATIEPTFEKEGLAVDQEIWDIFIDIAGKDFVSKYVQQYRLANQERSNALAHVEQSFNPAFWILTLNTFGIESKDWFDEEFLRTIVHEYSHILSLNTSQIDPSYNSLLCTTFFLFEGCAKEDSYLHAFVDSFWTDKEILQAEKEQGYGEETTIPSAYLLKKDAFVSEYAATDPVEDFSESFTEFIFEERPESSEKVSDQKIIFFYQFPELVEKKIEIENILNTVL